MERRHATAEHDRERPDPARGAKAHPESLQDRLGNRGLLALLRSGALQRKACSGGAGCECEACAMQRKAMVGPVDDPWEREADRVAEQAARPGPVAPAAPSLQRKPAAARGAAPAEAGDIGGGAPLPEAERTFFEARLGADFADVRVHSDGRAAQAARSVSARAFTLGRDVVFGAGEYRPGTDAGRTLLAHELTHVVQQRGGAGERIQRAAVTDEDVRIRGVFADAGRFTGSIFFDFASASVSGTERGKLSGIISAAGSAADLHLHGFASEEGDATFNSGLIDRRIAEVTRLLAARGFNATRIKPHPHPGERSGEIDYRRWRVVQMEVGDAPPPPPGCEGEPKTQACDPALFEETRKGSLDLLDKAIDGLNKGDATIRGFADRMFGATTTSADIVLGLQRIRAQMVAEVTLTPRALPTGGTQDRIICGTRCHDSCRQGFDAVTTGTGATSQIVLCPTFFEGGHGDPQLLAHETSHATNLMRPFSDPSGEGTTDLAYFEDRLMTHIGRLGLENGTTWQSFLILVAGGTLTLGPTGDVDAFPASRAADRDTAMTSLAQAERWVKASAETINDAYSTLNSAITRGATAGTPIDSTSWEADTIRDLDTQFTIHNPGQDPVAAPADENLWRMAGIQDRYLRLYELSQRGLTFKPRASGGVRWVGNTVEFGPDFFAAADVDRVKMILREEMRLVRFDPRGGLRAGLASAYLQFAQNTHDRWGLPP